MEDVRRIPGTTKRNGIYYLQRRVPADLVEAFGFPHFKESLETRDFHEARRRLNAANVRYDEVIDAKRIELQTGAFPLVPPAPLKLNALKARVREYVSSETPLRRAALSRKRWKQEPGSREKARAEIVATFEALRDPSDDFTIHRLQTVAVALCPENRFDDPDLGPIHNLRHAINGPFRDLLRRALLEIERRMLSFLDGDYSGAGLDPVFRLQAPAKPSETPSTADDRSQGVTLAELSKLRLAEHAKGTVRAQRQAQLAAAHSLILRHFGSDTNAASLTPSMCAKFRDLLAELPRDLTKRFAATEPLGAIAAQAKAKKLRTIARATQETYLGALREMMEWGLDNWKIDRNPANGLKSLTPNRRRERVDFNEELLERICLEPFMRRYDRMKFGSDPREGLADATRYWVPRIGLFTGMRQNEICQLDVSDIRKTQSGVHYFLVTDDAADKQLKNVASRKAVPVHDRLRNARFLDYVAAVRRAGHRKLFPDLTASKYGHYGAKVSKWITRQMRGAGYPAGVDFHAFRHTFRQALRHADTPLEIAARLGGWSSKAGLADHYGGELSDRWIEHMNRFLQKVNYGKAEPHIF
ncbi:DUF6538 domain-containing protein [Bosea sp. NPDC055594]